MVSPLSAIAEETGGLQGIKHVLLISIDGMHALDYANCSKGIATVNNGKPYCPNIASLGRHAVDYVAASASQPSDSFPGLLALVTGESTRSTGVFYDVSYDRSLSPPLRDPGTGKLISPDACPRVKGTVVAYTETIDKGNVDGGAIHGIDQVINPEYLPRDPKHDCSPVWPHQFLRVNTVFEVVRAAGGYTAWSDKHPSYEIVNGPSGKGLDDFYGPEIDSVVQGLPNVRGCEQVVDPTPGPTSVWEDSFQNIQCFDRLKLQAVLNQIDGKTHDGKPAAVPELFGSSFQSVSIGEKLFEKSLNLTGGYLDSVGTPSPSLLGEIEFMDNAIGQMVHELKRQGLYESTLIVITAKHGQSPIDPKQIIRIPPHGEAPSQILGSMVAAATEDDVSLLWLADQSQTAAAAKLLENNEALFGGGEVYSGNSLSLIFNDPKVDPRTPDILVTPTNGVIYTGGGKKLSEHGGFSHDDTNVVMLLSNPAIRARTVTTPVRTAQVAPTILMALGLDLHRLDSVNLEYTTPLPGLGFLH